MKRSIVFAGITGLVIACSGPDGGGGGTVTVTSAPADFSNAVCTKLDSCAPALTEATYGSVATCKERAAISTKNSLNAPGVTVTSSQLSDCLAAYNSISCGDLLGGSQMPKACDYRGTIADGAACGTDAQCASGSCYPSATDATGCGKCQARAALGGDCSSARCESGLYCSSGTAKKCTAYLKLGDTCTADSGDRCGGTTTCIAGKCAAALAENADCDAKTQGCDPIAFLQCVPSATDGTTAGKCTKVTAATAGQDCGLVSGKYVACGGGNYCKGMTGTAPGKCAATPKEPDDCTESKTCLSPARCNTKTNKCEILDPATCK